MFIKSSYAEFMNKLISKPGLKFYPKKYLGQNFLINPGILNKIVQAAEVGSEDIIVEIGPGTGNLTEKLSEKAGRVIAIEKDRRLIDELREKFKNTNVEIIEGDVLKLDIGKLFVNCKLKIENFDYKVVGNIPYYITSRLIRTIFEKRSSEGAKPRSIPEELVRGWSRPKLIVLTVQKEVAQRITAKPPHMNLLALSVQFYSDITIIGYVSKGSFRPTPKVDSAIVSLRPKAEGLKPAEKELFFKLIKAGFSGKRKQLISNLSRNFDMIREDLLKIFSKLDIKQDARAENLSIEQWKELENYIKG